MGTTGYDIAGSEPFSHEGELCSFDMFFSCATFMTRRPMSRDLHPPRQYRTTGTDTRGFWRTARRDPAGALGPGLTSVRISRVRPRKPQTGKSGGIRHDQKTPAPHVGFAQIYRKEFITGDELTVGRGSRTSWPVEGGAGKHRRLDNQTEPTGGAVSLACHALSESRIAGVSRGESESGAERL
jgi:hypothetical protein